MTRLTETLAGAAGAGGLVYLLMWKSGLSDQAERIAGAVTVATVIGLFGWEWPKAGQPMPPPVNIIPSAGS
jgi:hypothetical protein